MAFSASYIYQIKDQYSAKLERIAQKTKKFGQYAQKAKKRAREMGKAMKDFGGKLSTTVTPAMLAFGALAIKSAADLETMQVAFESMLGSADKSAALMKDLTEFTARTPFQLQGVGAAAKQLLAFGVAQDQVIPRLKMLGDIASGAKVPLSDMAAIFGKIKAKNKAMTEEILQLSDRGIPIIDVLAKQFGVAKDQVFEMASKSKISFKDITVAMGTMTSKGGIFFDQMAKQSGTLAGLFSTLRDNISLTMGTIGEEIVKATGLKDFVKDLTDSIGRLKENIIDFAKANPKLAKFIVILGGVAAVAGPVISAIGLLALGLTAISWPIVGIVAAVAAVSAAFVYWYNTSNPLIRTLTAMFAPLSAIWDIIGDVFGFRADSVPWAEMLSMALDGLGRAISFLLTPMALMLKLVGGAIRVIKNLVTGDFVGAISEAKQAWEGLKDVGGAAFDFGNAEKMAVQKNVSINQKQQVGVDMTVRADKGTEVTNISTNNQDVGLNLAGAY